MGALDVPFGIAVLWSTFGAEPYAKIIFQWTLAFPELFTKTTKLFTIKLDGGSLGPYMCLLGYCTFAHFRCRPYTKITYVCTFVSRAFLVIICITEDFL